MLQAITGHLPAGVGKSWENGTPKWWESQIETWCGPKIGTMAGWPGWILHSGAMRADINHRPTSRVAEFRA